MAGSLPRRQERLVLAWAELHQEDLLSNWQAFQQGHPPVKIEPLRSMDHEICRVVSFEKVAPFTLRVRFDDGISQVIDFRPVLEGELYGPLQILPSFDRVRIDSEVHTLVWPNGADFDPATLHNWPEFAPALRTLAEKWDSNKQGTHRVTP